MCDIATETNLIHLGDSRPVMIEADTQTEAVEQADFECQALMPQFSKNIQQIILPEAEDDPHSLSDNSFNTIDASRSGDRSPNLGNLSDQDYEIDIVDSWIPEIEQFIEKMKPTKKASTFYQAHQREKMTASADPSPRSDFRGRFSGMLKEEESTEGSVRLASQLSSMIDSYKQVCKERDYLKNLLKPYINKTREDGTKVLSMNRIARKINKDQDSQSQSPL